MHWSRVPWRHPLAHRRDVERSSSKDDFSLVLEAAKDPYMNEFYDKALQVLLRQGDWFASPSILEALKSLERPKLWPNQEESLSPRQQQVKQWLVVKKPFKKELCELCERVLTQKGQSNKVSETYEYDRLYVYLGNQHGCKFCGLIHHTLRALFDRNSRDMGFGFEIEASVDAGKACFGVMVKNEQDVRLYYNCVARLCTAEGLEAAPLGQPFSRCKEWMNTCVRHHDCASSSQHLELPTRLLRISKTTLRLVETSSWRRRHRYATLSYCWGGKHETKLTETTYKEFKKRISIEDLPLTYQHAVWVAKQLDLEYLWIDALCIIQEQEQAQDFLDQSAIMGDIYGGGFINIAASTSFNVHEGALTTPANFVSGLDIKLPGSSKHVYHEHVYHEEAWELAVTKPHLTTRGWAFQERLLSPRTVYLSRHGLFWECSEQASSAQSPSSIYDSRKDGFCLGRKQAWNWQRLIQAYSRTELSFKQDRLVAISGLARTQQQLTAGAYIAGMWRSDLVSQLIWRASHVVPRTQFWAPTWSWVSVDNALEYPDIKDIQPLVEVISADVKLVTHSDPYGPITSGTLTLSCPCLLEGRIYGDTFRVADTQAGHNFWPNCSQDARVESGDPVYLFPIAEHAANIMTDSVNIYALVITRHDGGTFCRRGLCIMTFRKSRQEKYEAFLDLMKGAGSETAMLVCSERTQGGKPMLTLV